ncbi:MAG: squalene--hopene cyclase [Pirellulaceae bacterium]|nr:MAG: squalene--hopene cyclase [Pirellulaceae bacterium]
MTHPSTFLLATLISNTALATAGLSTLLATALLAIGWRSRWVRQRPMTRYLLLSIYAHLVLMAFGSSISLFPAPAYRHGRPVTVELLEIDPESLGGLEQPSRHLLDSALGDAPTFLVADTSQSLPSPHGEAVPDSQPESSPVAVESAPPRAEAHTNPPSGDENLNRAEASTLGAVEPPPVPIHSDNRDLEPDDLAVELLTRHETADRRAEGGPEPSDSLEALWQEARQLAELPQRSADQLIELIQQVETHRIENQSAETIAARPNLQRMETVSAEVSSELDQRSEVRFRAADGEPVPELYRGRFEPWRSELLVRNGGSQETELAVQRALQWLVQQQRADGRWNAAEHGAGSEHRVLGQDRGRAGVDADTGVTGLALLALMGNGHTHFEGPYRIHVQRGLEFLLRSQASNGNLSGGAGTYAAMYCHGIAMLALAEACALTGDQRLRPALDRAQRFTIAAQSPVDGGWRYRPGDLEGDTSQFGWQLLALKSAEVAGVAMPLESRHRARRFLDRVSGGRYGGLASYRAGMPVSRAMTAEALVCRYFLDQPLSPPALQEIGQFLMQEPPGSGPVNLYYWYYASLGLYLAEHPAWQLWNECLVEQLLDLQVSSGPDAGSWPTHTVWGGYGGRIYTTSMAVLCLEVYYRYPRVGRPARIEEARQATGLLSR